MDGHGSVVCCCDLELAMCGGCGNQYLNVL